MMLIFFIGTVAFGVAFLMLRRQSSWPKAIGSYFLSAAIGFAIATALFLFSLNVLKIDARWVVEQYAEAVWLSLLTPLVGIWMARNARKKITALGRKADG